ncbi:MAG: hypothetical protein QME49_04805 [bacterium]|nr:hypothetical protein [bacterium]
MGTNRDDLFQKIGRAMDITRHGRVEFCIMVADGNPVKLETAFDFEPGIRIRQTELVQGKKVLNDATKDWC